MPQPNSLPKRAWEEVVRQGYEFAEEAGLSISTFANQNDVLKYFVDRAPHELPPPPRYENTEPSPVRFRTVDRAVALLPPMPGVSHVNCASLSEPHDEHILVCDMRQGLVMLFPRQPGSADPKILLESLRPAHAEAVDLDRDGFLDILVADLGTLFSSDERKGQVVWLRRDPSSDRYQPVVLAKSLGRVSDVQAADMDADGDTDLVVAEFGGRRVGSVLYFENRTTDWSEPSFHSHTLDPRSGAIHVPIVDLNGDARPDIVALVSQEHEEIIALLNEGRGQFRSHPIHYTYDPGYGSTGIQVVDMDQDGDYDILFSNGDSLQSLLVRPYHKVQWLENTGSFPFRHHELTTMPGVHRALAGDLDNDGDIDVVATSFLSNTKYPERAPMQLDSIIWLQNVGEMRFERHSLERIMCDHAAFDLADYDADGDLDLIVGNFSGDGMRGPPTLPPMRTWLSFWENLRKP